MTPEEQVSYDSMDPDRYYAMMPRKKWDGKAMIYSETLSRYFSSPDEVLEYEGDGDLESLRLIICDPIYPRPIEDDYWSDAFPDDWDGTLEDLAPEFAELVEAVNAYIEQHKPVLSWTPGKYALDLEGME